MRCGRICSATGCQLGNSSSTALAALSTAFLNDTSSANKTILIPGHWLTTLPKTQVLRLDPPVRSGWCPFLLWKVRRGTAAGPEGFVSLTATRTRKTAMVDDGKMEVDTPVTAPGKEEAHTRRIRITNHGKIQTWVSQSLAFLKVGFFQCRCHETPDGGICRMQGSRRRGR